MSCGSKYEDKNQKERKRGFNGSLELRTVRGRDTERERERTQETKKLYSKNSNSISIHVCVFNAHFYTSPYKD